MHKKNWFTDLTIILKTDSQLIYLSARVVQNYAKTGLIIVTEMLLFFPSPLHRLSVSAMNDHCAILWAYGLK